MTDLGGNLPFGIDLKLGSLADNGGQSETIKPLPGSPLINVGSNPAGLTTDQRGTGFPRVNAVTPDIGAFETNYPPSVRSVIVNGGAPQRSRVTVVDVTFDQPVTLPANPADAFQLVRQNDSAAVGLSASVATGETTVVTLTFTGPLLEGGSLPDGRYTLTVMAGQVAAASGKLDGNFDGTGGDDFVLTSAAAPNPPSNIFRFYGDIDGDGDVDSADFLSLRLTAGLMTGDPGFIPAFDSDGDGDVDAQDFLAFRGRFGASVP